MTLPTLIDVALGLALVFFILASIGSLLAELWAGYRKLRHRLLRDTVNRLLGEEISAEFWDHSLILPLYEPPPPENEAVEDEEDQAGDRVSRAKQALRKVAMLAVDYGFKRPLTTLKPRRAEAPAYLDAQLFANVVLDIATGRGAFGPIPNDIPSWRCTIKTTVKSIVGEDNDLQDHLLALLRQIPADTADISSAMKSATAKWYEEAMQRASGTYRRQTQKSLLFIGCILALALNVDTLRIAQVLYVNPELRKEIAQQAVKTYTERANANEKPGSGEPTQAQLKAYSGELRDLVKVGFPLGWMPVWRENFIRAPEPEASATSPAPNSPAPISIRSRLKSVWQDFKSPGWVALLAKFAGLAASAFAVCLGAPFWFDVLGRLVKLRSSAGADAEKAKNAPAPSGDSTGSGAAAPGGAPPSPGPAPAAPVKPAEPLSALDALSVTTPAFDASRAYWLAEFADHAYETSPTLLASWLDQHGFKLTASFDAHETQGFLAVSEKAAVLAFRGTEKKIEDWFTDAQIELVAGSTAGVPGLVHSGFAGALTTVVQAVDEELDALKGKSLPLHVTGHSLGGALATLAALRCESRASSAGLVRTVHTYGSPRVGDAAFAAAFQRTFRGRSFRTVNNEDIVTQVPPAVGYEHVGDMVFIDEAGHLYGEMSFTFRLLNFATNALGDVRDALKTKLKDHSMQFYCGFLKKAAQSPRSQP
jgi:hypothetical protein